ncbi:MAG: RDD family protein [Bacilli bacterium]|nr:RDD family protein [Bacilli bacterium]
MQYNFEKRSMAYLVDIIIAFVAASLYVVFAPSSDALSFLNNLSRVFTYYTVFFFVYCFLCYALFNGVTIGRLIFGTAIRNKDYTRMSIGTCALRALLQAFIPLSILNLAYMFINRTEESFFNKATDTISVYLR